VKQWFPGLGLTFSGQTVEPGSSGPAVDLFGEPLCQCAAE
jgi:hypothetical protein